MATILDFQGREFNTQHDIVVFIRECVDGSDRKRAREFTAALREVLPETADDTIAFLAGWAYPAEPNKVTVAIRTFDAKSNLFGDVSPREKTRGHWQEAAEHPHLKRERERVDRLKKEREEKDKKKRDDDAKNAPPLQDQIDAGVASAAAVASSIFVPFEPNPTGPLPITPAEPAITPTGPQKPGKDPK